MKKKLIGKLFLFALATLIFKPGIIKAAADATIAISPASITTTTGSNFSVDVTINPLAHYVTNADFYFTYDQTKFTLTSITKSATFSNVLSAVDGSGNPAVPSPANGTGSYSAATAFGSHISSTTTYATLNFQAVAAATNSPITITPGTTMVYADNSPTYPSDAGTNVVGTRSNGAVTVTVGAVDSTAPVLGVGSPSGTLPAGTTQTTVSLTTNENATCKYGTSSGVAYGSMTSIFSTTGSTSHSFLATGLVDGGSYGFFVRCQDGSNNSNSGDKLIAFSVASPSNTVSSAVVTSIAQSSDKDSKSSDKDKKKTKSRTITNSKKTIKFGQTLTQRGKKFSKNSFVQLYFGKPGGGYYAPQKVKTSSTGSFILTYRVNKPKGTYPWYVVDVKTGKKSKTVSYKVK